MTDINNKVINEYQRMTDINNKVINEYVEYLCWLFIFAVDAFLRPCAMLFAIMCIAIIPFEFPEAFLPLCCIVLIVFAMFTAFYDSLN